MCGNVKLNGNNDKTKLKIHLSGNGNISGDGTVRSMDADISGSIEGFQVLTHIRGDISGSGHIFGSCLSKVSDVKSMYLNISGSGSVKRFHVLENIKVDISGSASGFLTHCKNCSVKIRSSGSGKIRTSEQ